MSVLVRTVVGQVEVADAWFSFPKHDHAHALYLHYLGVVQTKGARAVNLALSPLILTVLGPYEAGSIPGRRPLSRSSLLCSCWACM